jgi:hypothetical protein
MKSEKLRIRGPRKTKVFWGIEKGSPKNESFLGYRGKMKSERANPTIWT